MNILNIPGLSHIRRILIVPVPTLVIANSDLLARAGIAYMLQEGVLLEMPNGYYLKSDGGNPSLPVKQIMRLLRIWKCEAILLVDVVGEKEALKRNVKFLRTMLKIYLFFGKVKKVYKVYACTVTDSSLDIMSKALFG